MTPLRTHPARAHHPRAHPARAVLSAGLSVGLSACLGLALAACSAPAEVPVASTSKTSTSSTSSTISSSAVTSSAPAPVIQDVRLAVARLMMVGVNDYDDALRALQLGAGGIFIRGDSSKELLATPGRDIAALRAAVGRPFDVAIDFEGGRVLRHADILGQYPAPGVMARTMSPQQVRDMAYGMGSSLRAHGITVNFAPVVDLDGAGLEVVGDRAFSTDPTVATEYAASFAAGMRDAGVTPVFKHFPGHGHASGDTHLGPAVTPPLPELEKLDLVPYARLLAIPGTKARENKAADNTGNKATVNKAGATKTEPQPQPTQSAQSTEPPLAIAGPNTPEPAVLMGHLLVPELGELPASLNPAAYQLLREGSYPGGVPFEGLIYTDDLSGMRAITDRMPVAEAVVQAITAGADQALWINTAGLEAAIARAEEAVLDGRLDKEQLARQVARVQRHQEGI